MEPRKCVRGKIKKSIEFHQYFHARSSLYFFFFFFYVLSFSVLRSFPRSFVPRNKQDKTIFEIKRSKLLRFSSRILRQLFHIFPPRKDRLFRWNFDVQTSPLPPPSNDPVHPCLLTRTRSRREKWKGASIIQMFTVAFEDKLIKARARKPTYKTRVHARFHPLCNRFETFLIWWNACLSNNDNMAANFFFYRLLL